MNELKKAKPVVEFRFEQTVLGAYCRAQFYIDTIDALIKNLAITSHGAAQNFYVSTNKQLEKICALIDKRDNLIYLREAVDAALMNLHESSAALLRLRYFAKLPVADAAAELKVSLRTFFRRANVALTAFGRFLAADGVTEEWFLGRYLDQRWIKELYCKT